MSDQVSVLKDRLRKQYLRMRDTCPDYSCGHELTKHISADYSEACRAVNETLDELARIDPSTPTKRF